MAKAAGVCTKEMTEYLKWRNLPSINNYIQFQFLCEKAYTLMAEAQSSGFENKDALKKAANIFFEILRKEPFIQAYVGLGYLFLLLDQKNNAILYLAEARKINPHDEDTIKLIEHTLKEDPSLKVHVHDPSFNDDEQEFYNFLDDHHEENNINHLDLLPAELLVLIFDWLKPASVAKFRQVNKHYRDLLVSDVYWQGKYGQRWLLPNIEELKKICAPIPDNQFYYRFFQLNHNMNINWLNRATKFEEIKKIKGKSDAFCTAPEQGMVTVHSLQQENGQYKRLIEFFCFKREKLHRIKRLQLKLDVSLAHSGSTTTFTGDHLISLVKDGTLVFTEIQKRESAVHKVDGPIDFICGLPRTNGIQFLAGCQNSLAYYDGLEKKNSIEVCDNGFRLGQITAQYEGKTAAILTTSPAENLVKILDIESASVVETFSVGTQQRLEWTMAMPDVLIGLDRGATFYDVRTKNKFMVPKTSFANFIGVVMDDVKVLALSKNSLTLFDCRYSSSIVDQVSLPKGHKAAPGMALWCSQKVFYASEQSVVEWDMGQVIRQNTN